MAGVAAKAAIVDLCRVVSAVLGEWRTSLLSRGFSTLFKKIEWNNPGCFRCRPTFPVVFRKGKALEHVQNVSAPQTFALSGSFDVVREVASTPSPYDPTTSIYFTRIHFDAVPVDLGGAGAVGFSFPSFAGLVNGTALTGSDDPCFFSFGSCSGVGLFNSTYAGDFDSHTFFLNGISPLDFFDSFAYRIVATAVAPAATVPEPGTLACVAVAGAGWAASRRRRGRRDIQ